jgi:hypothetical protein
MPEPPHELPFSRDCWYLAHYFWAIGDDKADPYHLSVPERLDELHRKGGVRIRGGV